MRDLPKHRWNTSTGSTDHHHHHHSCHTTATNNSKSSSASLSCDSICPNHNYSLQKTTTTTTMRHFHSYKRIIVFVSLCFLTSIVLTNQVRFVWRMMRITTSSSSSSSSSRLTMDVTPPVEIPVWPPMDLIDALFLKQNAPSRNVPPSSSHKTERRLVIAASNGQYADFATNFAHSLLSHNMVHFVFVPLDALAYTILHERFPDHTLPVLPELVVPVHTSTTTTTSTTTENTESGGGASFRSKAFEILTSSRPIFLEHFLRQNITIFYNDIDMVWQYNAWETIDQLLVFNRQYDNEDHPIHSPTPTTTTTTTVTTTTANAPPPPRQYDVLLWKDGPVQICTCLIYMVPSTTSFQIIQEWKDEIQTHLHPNDQKAFLVMAQKQSLLPSKHSTMKKKKKKNTSSTTTSVIDTSKVRIFANSEQFPTGAMYDWETQIQQVSSSQSSSSPNLEEWKPFVPALSSKQTKTNPQKAIIIHNNWIEGKLPKIQRFVQSQLWFVGDMLE